MIEKRIETRTPTGVTLVENRYDSGLVEIGLYRDPVIANAGKIPVAVVSRAEPGNKWFVHADRNRAFWSRSKQRAVDYATAYAEREIRQATMFVGGLP